MYTLVGKIDVAEPPIIGALFKIITWASLSGVLEDRAIDFFSLLCFLQQKYFLYSIAPPST